MRTVTHVTRPVSPSTIICTSATAARDSTSTPTDTTAYVSTLINQSNNQKINQTHAQMPRIIVGERRYKDPVIFYNSINE